MTQVSKRFLPNDINIKIQNLFQQSIIFCSNKELTNGFISDLLTPTEKIMLSKRLAVAYFLLRDYPYRSIRSILKVSSPTIWSVSLVLKTKGSGLRQILKKVQHQKEWRNIFHELEEIAVQLLANAKGSNWKAGKTIEYQVKKKRQSDL